MILYNLFPLLAGKFSDWTPHLERAAEMGFDWIFVNPVQKTGSSGSLYSVADYFQLNPLLLDPSSALAPDEQLEAAIKTAESLGLKMMIDLVINHCAVDSPIAQQHPNWFVHESDGSIAHPFCIDNGRKVVWGDLIRFDHEHTSDPEGLYKFFRSIVEHMIELGFKGFRCDAAYQIPKALWQRLMRDIKKKHPDAIFAAETLGCTAKQTLETAQAGFDFIFNSSKWWDFESNWLKEQYHLLRQVVPSIGFPESHDTERLMQESGGNIAALKQRYLFAAVFSAGVMIPIGFEFGFRKRLHVVDTRPGDWEKTDIDLTDFIRKVNTFKKRYPIFQEESINSFLPYENSKILLMWKASHKISQEALIILNKDVHNRQHFHTANLHQFIQAGEPLQDVSPEYPMDYLPRPFSYDLNPGQGLVLVAE
ncbi:MAG: alpha-amylase family glycosyl hydrolase [Candidatus Competibacteraceae bacterium]